MAFMLGLVGSFHCAGMCGPLAMALPHSQCRGFVSGRMAYNTGRIVTYCMLGLVFGLVGKSFSLVGLQRGLSIVLGVVLILSVLAPRKLTASVPIAHGVNWLKQQMASSLRSGSFSSLTVLGLLNGLLPCGLVYVACAAATISGNILGTAQYMAMFGLGTMPMMLGISLSGKVIPASFRLRMLRAIPIAVFCLGTLLILRGMSLGIPYISPDLTGNSSCCHK